MDMSLDDMIAAGHQGGGGGPDRSRGRRQHGGRGSRRRGDGQHTGGDLRARLVGREAGGSAGGWQPPLPPGRPPSGHHHGGVVNDGMQQRPKAPTLKGWAPSGNKRADGRDCFEGDCEGCGKRCEVQFRPVRGGNPPVCGDCHQSLRAVQDQAAGPERGGRQARRYDPYGAGRQQMVMMVPPHMMAGMMGRGGRGGRGGRSNVWTPTGAAAQGGPTKGPTSKTWVRPGAEAEDENAAGTGSRVPCSFFAAGNCRYGDSCRFSHDPELVAAVGDGADSVDAEAGDEELPEIDMNDDQ